LVRFVVYFQWWRISTAERFIHLGRTWAVFATTTGKVAAAISVLAIVVLGTAFFSSYTSGQIGLGRQHRAAIQLASQKLEQLRADNEIGIAIPEGETSDEVSSGDLSYTPTTKTCRGPVPCACRLSRSKARGKSQVLSRWVTGTNKQTVK